MNLLFCHFTELNNLSGNKHVRDEPTGDLCVLFLPKFKEENIKWKETKLTEAKGLFATEHHNVLEVFCSKRGLDFEDYYDVVVFKFLSAVKQYDECESLHNRTFTDVAVNLTPLIMPACKKIKSALDFPECRS